MSEIIKYETDGPVARITLYRPDSMNAFTSELCADLLEALELASNDEAIRVVILTGDGRCFSAGADLKGGLEGRAVYGKLQYEYRPVLMEISLMPKPVVCAIPGSAAGIGLSVALTCDLLIMADNAFMLSPFTTISLVPDGGLNWQLVRQLGYRRAFQLAIECERIPAADCVQLGLANRTAAADELQDETMAWAQTIAKRAPLSISATKRVMRHAMDHNWPSSYDLEADFQQSLLGSHDNEEGVAAFFDKREPEFKGN
ncbi:MAG: enoyl-CoA hydratase-related protein [Pseudomonadota bacterium]